jgi:hypothetical protein
MFFSNDNCFLNFVIRYFTSFFDKSWCIETTNLSIVEVLSQNASSRNFYFKTLLRNHDLLINLLNNGNNSPFLSITLSNLLISNANTTNNYKNTAIFNCITKYVIRISLANFFYRTNVYLNEP